MAKIEQASIGVAPEIPA